MSATLGEQVTLYSNSGFNAEVAARNFFSEHSENEVHQKLNELANLQNQIETSLRQKVRDNYGLFMYANDEINRVGEEMSDLKHLLTSTKKMLEELQSLRPTSEGVAGRRGSDLSFNMPPGDAKTTMHSFQDVLPSPTSLGDSSSSSMPSWVVNTPREIERFIVEQQFSKATALVLRSLAYLDSVKGVGDNEAGIRDVATLIQKKRLLLAQTLRDSLGKVHYVQQLSSSELFGAAEQTKRLKLLISLGHSALAAQGFATGRKDVIRKALRYVEASGDPAAFTAELSRVFFVNLRDACQSFLDLFSKPSLRSTASLSSSAPVAEESDGLVVSDETNVASLSYLVGWLQDQMTVFVTALARQIQVGAAEYAAEVFQLQMSALLKHHGADKVEQSDSCVSRMSLSPNNSLKRASSLLHQVLSAPGDGAVIGRGVKRVSSVSRVPLSRTGSSRASVVLDVAPSFSIGARATEGPLTFTSRCLHVAFREAVVLDRLGLQGASSLSWNMMPEIKSIVNSFADDMIKDIENKVLQDNWVKMKCANSEVTLPQRAMPKSAEEPRHIPVSDSISKPKSGLSSLFGGVSSVEDDDDNISNVENTLISDISIHTSISYQWVVALLTYFIGEVYALLQVHPPEALPNPTGRKSGSGDFGQIGTHSSTYSRVDLCEIEPEAVACVLRILIRYVRAIISLDLHALSHEQRDCYYSTIEEVKVSLLPSAEDAILKGFFSDGSTLIANPPKAVFKHLRANLQAASFREIKD